ncbi:aminoglycoside phosphotransferase family protein [Pseudoteredinibacter isoporae]|uniref:aminoglycoside phosphotransferase family protein n=1 Tax=Pseudoteredinibacter isoporae TaxID=570281 RepID=UPI00310A79D7
MSASDHTPKQYVDITPDLSFWIRQELSLEELPSLSALGGDAGFRRYFRLDRDVRVDGRALMAVFAPPEAEKNEEFVAMAELLTDLGVKTPKIFAKDLTRGFFVLEDLGNQHLFDVLAHGNVADLYDRSSDLLLMIQRGEQVADLPVYDEELLMREMALFSEWFVPQLLGYTLSDVDQQILDSSFEALAQSALQQPYRLVHRDYHSRNIMLNNGELSLIDFQDAVWGPISYDLVSLLRDCYVHWPDATVRKALQSHWQKMPAELKGDMDLEQFQKAFDWMGLQRHIKVLGIFARLALRDSKPAYLNDLPLVIRYTLDVAERYEVLADFVAWFKRSLLPLCEQQDWYQDYKQAGEQGAHLRREMETPVLADNALLKDVP